MGISGRTANFFLQSRLTPLIALLAMLLGLFAVLVTPREEEPQINVTLANVFIAFPGASARDVENLVATPAEQVLSQISGIEHIYAVSRPGMAVLTVQFKVGEDRIQSLVRLYDVIQSHRDWISPDLGVAEPIIKPVGIDDVPIVSFTLWSEDSAKGAFDLQQVAHAAEIELKRIAGTREVYTLGGPQHVVRVLLDAEALNAFRLSPLDIRDALQLSNASQPSGKLTADNREILVQTGAFLSGSADVKQLVVGVHEGKPVFMSDVARIEDGPDQPSRYVWLGTGAAAAAKGITQRGEFAAVTLAITKKPGENAVAVAENIIRRMEQLQGSIIPAGVHATVTRDYGETANDKAMKLIQKLIFATLAVVALVWFVLGRREAVIVGVAVLLTLAATLFASWAWGFTLNRVSLFALIFSIGILVDDAIVVVENIHRRRELEPGRPLREIIPEAVDEVGSPTILATFTVIAALLPMAFVTGLMGPYMSPIPINASIGMVISLAIAFIVTPWLALKLTDDSSKDGGKKMEDGSHDVHGSRTSRWVEAFFLKRLTPLLNREQGAKNRRKLWIGVAVAILLASSLAAVKLVILKMLPFDNKSEFQVVVDMPVGTPLEQTARVLREIGAYLATVPEVTDYQAYAGAASPINFNGLVRQYYLRSGPEVGDIQVNLLAKAKRDRNSHDIAATARAPIEKIAQAHGAKVKVVEVPPGPPVMSPIVAEIYGPDYAGQMRVAKKVRAAFADTADIVGIDDSVEDNADKLTLKVLQNKAALRGVAQADIVQVMRMGLAGENVTPIHGGAAQTAAKYEIPVRVTLPAERLGKLDDLLKLTVRARDGALIPLSELVQVTSAERDKTIYHKNLLPVVYVVGDMAGDLDSPLYGMFGIRNKLNEIDHGTLAEGGTLGEYFIRQPEDPYRGYAIKWDGEWQVTYETFRDMGIAYAVGLLLIYLLVVAQFGSYTVPLIIMAPIPLTVIGVMPGHALLGAQFTATSMIGMIALAGIIVRNSILLVDFINLQVAQGMDLQRAVIAAATARAKPIVLTGMAAMLGAFFILDDPIFNGLAIALIFGILVSTLLTLVVIPVLYYALRYRLEKSAILPD